MRKKMSHKLSKDQKDEIIRLLESKYSPTDIAKKFGVSRTTVYNIHKQWLMNNK